MRQYITCFWGLCLLLLGGCAQMVAPGGGPKDTTPPKVVSYSPADKSTNFTSAKILIKFDEYIQLKDLSKQLIVSPPLKYTPVTKIKKGKALEVDIKDTLQKNTTYTFNFGNAIADIHEGNQIQGFQYVFSTGSYIDSLKLSGNVKDAFTGDAQKDALVMLYGNLNDSAPYNKPPSYCGRTNVNGHYEIDNIKKGTYRLFVLSNSQNGYFYHPYTESIGFNSKPVKINANDSVDVLLFTEEEPALHFEKATAVAKGDIMLIFNKPADSLSVKPLYLPQGSKPPYTHIQYSVTGDTAHYWINTPGLDSLRFIVNRNNKILDTGMIYYFPGNTKSKKAKKPEFLKISCNVHNKQADYNYHQPIVLSAEHPLMKYNLSRIFIIHRKDTLTYTVDSTGLPFRLSLTCKLTGDSSYTLMVLPGAFTDVFGLVNDTIKTDFKIVEPAFFGSLQLNLKFAKKASYVIQLLNSKDNVLKQDIVKSAGSINYNALPPDTYRFRAIEDANNDGKWTTGDYLKNIQPEKVHYFSQPITVRSDWDLSEDWIVNSLNL